MQKTRDFSSAPLGLPKKGFGGGGGGKAVKLESHMNTYAKGKMTASQLRKAFKDNGYHIDSLRGNNPEINAYKIGPDGKPKGSPKKFSF